MNHEYRKTGSCGAAHARGRSGNHRDYFALRLAVIALLLVAASACQKETKTTTETPPASAVVVDSVLSPDGVLIRYDVRGSGDRALVFVHCWSCDRTHWADQAEYFGRTFRVVTLDLAGHGESGANRAEWTMAAYGGDVAAVVEKLNLPEVILVGHSMGGAVIVEAARRLGGRVVALVGVDNMQNLGRVFDEPRIQAFLSLFEADFPGTTYEFVSGLIPATADSALADRICTQLASAPKGIAIDSFRHLIRYDFAAALSDVRLPIRCINSDQYPTDVEGNGRIAESFAVRIMPGVGHFPHLIDPAGFNRQLQETVAEFWPGETEP